MNETPPSSPDPYADIVALYDMEHDDFLDDLDLIVQFGEEHTGSMLEMGCGSGRVIVPLAESGFVAHGVDLSGPMLDRARQRATEAGVDVSLHKVGMDQVDKIEADPFGAVLFTLNALTHIDDQQQQFRALHTSFNVLARDGLLFLDLLNPMPDYLNRLADHRLLEWSSDLPDGTTIDKWTYRAIDPISQIIDTTIWYDHLGTGGTTRTVRTRFSLRYLHHSELVQMLDRIGFEQVTFFGSYMLDPLQPDSDRMLVTAVKP